MNGVKTSKMLFEVLLGGNRLEVAKVIKILFLYC